MQDNRRSYFEKIQSNLQLEYIRSQTICVLCGSDLELLHSVSPEEGTVKEEAYCESCHLKTRTRQFSLN